MVGELVLFYCGEFQELENLKEKGILTETDYLEIPKDSGYLVFCKAGYDNTVVALKGTIEESFGGLSWLIEILEFYLSGMNNYILLAESELIMIAIHEKYKVLTDKLDLKSKELTDPIFHDIDKFLMTLRDLREKESKRNTFNKDKNYVPDSETKSDDGDASL